MDENALNSLKNRIIENPAGYYTKLPVVPREFVDKESFCEDLLPSLILETLGGNHLRRASRALAEDPRFAECDLIKKRDIVLYIGLTDDEAEALAIQHHSDQSGAHPLTLMEKVAIVRRNWAIERGITEDDFLEDEVMPNAKMCDLLGEHYDKNNLRVTIRINC